MSIVRLNFDFQIGQISARSSPARLNISMPRGQMRIRNQKPQLQIDTQMPTFTAPRQRINNESGLMGPLALGRKFRDEGRQAALRAAAEYKNDGNYVANPRIPGDKSFPMLSKIKMNRYLGRREFNIGLMPSSPPSLEWQRGYINVESSKHDINVDWTGSNLIDMTVDIDFPVNVSMSRRPHFAVTGTEPAVQNSTLANYNSRAATYDTYSRYINRTV